MPFFVEIGSCDFDTCRPLVDQGWSGVVVEANPEIFSKVQNVFKRTSVQCVNYAVTDRNEEVEIKHATGWGWARGITHVVSDHHIGARLSDDPKNENNFGKTVSVQGITLDSLISVCNISKIDFLKIDTEGHEINILNGFNFSRVRPKFIKIEHRLTDDQRIMERLRLEGYLAWVEENDIYAVG